MKSRWEFVEYRFTLEQIAEDCHKIEALLKKKIQGKNWTLDEATTYGLAQFNLKKQYLPALYRTIYKMAKRGAGDGYVRPFDIMMNKVMELI